MEQKQVDWPGFIASMAFILVVCLPLAMNPETAGASLQTIYNFISNEMGIFYLLAAVGTVGFLAWLAFSRFGNVKL